jgi:hypothetical protein
MDEPMIHDAPLRTFHTVEPPLQMRAEGYAFDHEIRVALPASYGDGDRSYPVLWITDNVLENALPILHGPHTGIATELILVSVGPGSTRRARPEARPRSWTSSSTRFAPRSPPGTG